MPYGRAADALTPERADELRESTRRDHGALSQLAAEPVAQRVDLA